MDSCPDCPLAILESGGTVLPPGLESCHRGGTGIRSREGLTHSNSGDRDLRQGFVSGLHEMIERIDPPVIFLHGTVSDRGIAAAGRKTHIVHFVDDRSRVRQAA